MNKASLGARLPKILILVLTLGALVCALPGLHANVVSARNFSRIASNNAGHLGSVRLAECHGWWLERQCSGRFAVDDPQADATRPRPVTLVNAWSAADPGSSADVAVYGATAYGYGTIKQARVIAYWVSLVFLLAALLLSLRRRVSRPWMIGIGLTCACGLFLLLFSATHVFPTMP